VILAGRRVIVTGSTRGLGRAFALAAAAAGAAVVVNGRDAANVAAVVAHIRDSGGRAAGVAGSVADDEVAAALVNVCVEHFGGVDVVVNNAGIVRDRTLLNMTTDEFDEVVAVNLRGTWSVSRHAAKVMKDSGGGLLLQVISGSAFIGSFGQSNYAASKAGVLGLMYAWSAELQRYNIRTNAFWPVAQTDMTGQVVARLLTADGSGRTPEELGFGRPEQIAQAVVFLCSHAADELSNQIVLFNGRKLATFSHIRESAAEVRDSWTLAEIGRALAGSAEPVYSFRG
jgi:NAD(P)-dependent dehydrogenase (short-subunit alcohol dehydrogenase family)